MSTRRCPSCIISTSLFLAVLVSTSHAQSPAPQWKVDHARSAVGFRVTKFGFADVDGRFRAFTAKVTYDQAHPERSSVTWEVRIESVQTDAPGRDRSITAPEYFDAARYPTMSFRSEAVRPLDEGRLEVTGLLTIKGHAEPMTVIVNRMAGGFETRFEVDRLRYGVRGGTVMNRLIGRMVRVHLVLRGTATTTTAVAPSESVRVSPPRR